MARALSFVCLLWGTLGGALFFPFPAFAVEPAVGPMQEAAAPIVTQQNNPAEFEAIRAEFFSGETLSRRKDVPWFWNMETVSFAVDEELHPLRSFPDTELFRRKNDFYLRREGTDRLLGSPAGTYDATLPWPEVAVADIDYDGIPDFFILERSGHTDSSYRFVSGNSENGSTTAVFLPFAGQTPHGSPDPFPEYDIFTDGVGGIPAFLPEERAVEFYRKNGPYADAERWCFETGRYFLCEKRRLAYYPASDNNDLIFTRVARFDEKGNMLGVSCRPLESVEPLRLTAMADVPLYAEPAESSSGLVLSRATTVRVMDYRLVEGSEDMRLWYRIQDEAEPVRAGWCCVTVDVPTIQDGRLVFGNVHNESIRAYFENLYAVVSLERMEKGAKAVLRRKDGDTLSLENIPVMFPYPIE